MSWSVGAITAEGTELVNADTGARHVLPVVDSTGPYELPGHQALLEVLDSVDNDGDQRARDYAAAEGLISVHRLAGAKALWLDHTESPRGDDLVGVLKIASPAAREYGRLLVMAGLVAVNPDDDYDSLPALAAAVIRLRVDQWVGIGIEAKALATQVGLEGSWDGESLWLEQAPDAYDYLRDWAGESDIVLFTGHRFGELPGLLEKVGVGQ